MIKIDWQRLVPRFARSWPFIRRFFWQEADLIEAQKLGYEIYLKLRNSKEYQNMGSRGHVNPPMTGPNGKTIQALKGSRE